MSGSMDDRKAVDAIYLNFWKIFDTVCHNIIVSEWRENSKKPQWTKQ